MVELAIEFKGKIQTVYNHGDDSVAWRYVKVPAMSAKYVDRDAFRRSRAFGPYANSDLFPAMLTGALKKAGIMPCGELRLDRLPEGVTVDESGFLAKVRVCVPDAR